MADYAHTETDKRIEELEKRLQAEYRQAYRETKGKLEKYLSDFARKDEAKRKLVEKGELSQADYKKWRTNQMLTGQRWTKMVDTLAKDMNRTNQIAADIISGDLKGTFALNANFAAYGIENGFQTDFGFTLYNEDTVNRLIEENPDLLPAPRVDIPEDVRWNKQKITSNITQAVLQGKSIPEIAKTMQTVVGMNKASATRNARTAMTGAQNAGRQQAYDRAKAMGIKVKKEWVATLDGRTRHSHGMADGQQVELDGKFKVGASELRYPGDPQGAAEEVYNCRCTMVTVEPPEILRGEEPRMTYQEWYKGKENAGNGGKNIFDEFQNGGVNFLNIDKLDKQALDESLQAIKEVLLDFDLPLSTLKSVEGIDEYNAIMGTNGFNKLSISNAKYSSYQSALKANANDNNRFVSSGIRGTATHEAGHIVMNAIYQKTSYNSNLERAKARLKGKLEKQIIKEAAKKYGSNPQISVYGSTKFEEKVAEAVSDVYTNGNNANPFSKMVVEVIKKYLRQ